MNEHENQKVVSSPKLNKTSLLDFVGTLIQQDLSITCRRQHSRHSLRLTLSIQPLSEDFLPDGEYFSAMSSDISLKGMSFVNPDSIQHEYLRITFVHHEVSVIAKVRHNSSIGIEYPLFLVGVEFLDEYYHN